MYHYFISYNFTQFNGSGDGMCTAVRSSPITTYDEILDISEQIEKNNHFRKVIIINYVLLRKEEEK